MITWIGNQLIDIYTCMHQKVSDDRLWVYSCEEVGYQESRSVQLRIALWKKETWGFGTVEALSPTPANKLVDISHSRE